MLDRTTGEQESHNLPSGIENFMRDNPKLAKLMRDLTAQMNPKQLDILEQVIRLATGPHDIRNGNFGRAQFDTLVRQLEDAGTVQDLNRLLLKIFAASPDTNPHSFMDRVISHRRIDQFESEIGNTGKLRALITNLTRQQRTELDAILFAEIMVQGSPLYPLERPAQWTDEQWETLQSIIQTSRRRKISLPSKRKDEELKIPDSLAIQSPSEVKIDSSALATPETPVAARSPNAVSRWTGKRVAAVLGGVGTLALATAGTLGLATESGRKTIAETTNAMRSKISNAAAAVLPGTGFDDSEEEIDKTSNALKESDRIKAEQEWETIRKSPVNPNTMRPFLQAIIRQWGDTDGRLSPQTLPYYDALTSRIADSLQTSQKMIEDSLQTGDYTTAIQQAGHARFLGIEAESAGISVPSELLFDEYQLSGVYAKAIQLLENELPSLKPPGPKDDTDAWRTYIQRRGELDDYRQRQNTLPKSDIPGGTIVQR